MTDLYIPERGIINVYHFLIYMLSNLRHIDFIPDKIYIDLRKDQFRNSFDYPTEILTTLYPNSTIIDVPNHHGLDNCLHLPQHNTFPNGREGGIEGTAYEFLRELFLPHLQNYVPSQTYSDHIYVSRFDTTKRRILNEDDILNDTILPGFQKIIMTNLPLLEQMYIFANAKVIISCHGAALVNILFCRKDIKIIEIASNKISKLLHFQDIAETFQFNYARFCDVTETRVDDYDSDLIINDSLAFHNMVFEK